ncbi:MAG TPA: hypothetical protein VNO30_23730 [Kofleriaceae bacterium]|nr:hypothetical protein [Kofleriaceae bacterium]
MNPRRLAHLSLRLTLGVNIAVHGLVRVTDPLGFAEKLVELFAGVLPRWAVLPFAAALPFLELAVGLAVLVGARLMHALFCGALVMTALTFGTCLRQDWPGAGLQLCYAIAYAILLGTLEHAHWTLTKREASWTSN